MAASRASLVLTAATLLACALIGAAPGIAKEKTARPKAPAPEPPMTVHVVTSAEAGCEPDCPQWIAAQGQIVEGSRARFQKVLKQVGKKNLPVLIHSGGGLAEEALAIGRLVRKQGLDVAVAKTALTSCAPRDAACRKKTGKTPLRGSPEEGFSMCASSCTFILAAGKRRFVRGPAFVGVHRGERIMKQIQYTYRMVPYRGDDGAIRYRKRLVSQKVVSQKRTVPPKALYARYERYFAGMGVGKEIIALMTATPNESVHWLTHAELRRTGIATHRLSGAQLVRGVALPEDGGWLGPDASLPAGVPHTGTIPRGEPVAPMLTGQETPAGPASECARTGTGCSWDVTPGAAGR